MNNDYQHNNNHHNINNNGFDNDYHRRITPPPPPAQIDDEINDHRNGEQRPHSPHRQQLISPSTQV
jgi:hypothetical protein